MEAHIIPVAEMLQGYHVEWEQERSQEKTPEVPADHLHRGWPWVTNGHTKSSISWVGIKPLQNKSVSV